jgi:hypothetical protein
LIDAAAVCIRSEEPTRILIKEISYIKKRNFLINSLGYINRSVLSRLNGWKDRHLNYQLQSMVTIILNEIKLTAGTQLNDRKSGNGPHRM